MIDGEHIHRRVQECTAFITAHPSLTIFFVATTVFFLYQHTQALGWDFIVYMENAQYFLGQSPYFEWYRPPLTPLLFAAFSVFSWAAAEYLYIVFVSAFFFYSVVRLADAVDVDPAVFYAVSITPFTLRFATAEGTELLSLAFLYLFSAAFLTTKRTGVWAGFAFLARYTNIFLFPLMLIDRDVKRIARNAVVTGLIILPWLTYNFVVQGNMLASPAYAYALNVLYRQYLSPVFVPGHLLTAVNIVLPLLVIGLYVESRATVKQFRRHGTLKKDVLLFLFIAAVTVISYYRTPMTVLRYLFPLVLPTAYFSARGVQAVRKHISFTADTVVILFILVNGVVLATTPKIVGANAAQPYDEAADIVRSQGIDRCDIRSNHWPYLLHRDVIAAPTVRKEMFNGSVRRGVQHLFFQWGGGPPYAHNRSFLSQFPVRYNSSNVVVVGREGVCAQGQVNYAATTPQRVNWYTSTVHNYSINTNPCFLLFQETGVLEKTCNFVHGDGFTRDENRVLP